MIDIDSVLSSDTHMGCSWSSSPTAEVAIMEPESFTLTRNIHDPAWWHYAALIGFFAARPHYYTLPFSERGTTMRFGDDDTVDAEIVFTVTGNRTAITLRATGTPEQRDAWRAILDNITIIANDARSIQIAIAGPKGMDVIEEYYRARAAGRKVTLRQLAAQYGFNAKYLSDVKRAYDAAGGYGAKKKDSDKKSM